MPVGLYVVRKMSKRRTDLHFFEKFPDSFDVPAQFSARDFQGARRFGDVLLHKDFADTFQVVGQFDRANSISSNLNGSSSKTQKSPEAFSVPGLSKSSSSDVRLKYPRFFAKTRLSTLGVCLDKNADRYVGSEDFVSSYVAKNLLSTAFLKASAISSASVAGRLYRLASFQAVISICFSAYVSMRTDRFLSTALSIAATKVFYISRYKFSPKKNFCAVRGFSGQYMRYGNAEIFETRQAQTPSRNPRKGAFAVSGRRLQVKQYKRVWEK